MSNGIVINVPLVQYLDFGGIEKEDLARAELKVSLQIQGYKEFPLCLGRQHLPSYLHLLGAEIGAEMGVWRGEYSAHLLKHWPGQLLMIDAWQEQGAGYRDVANVSQAEHEANYRAAQEAVGEFSDRCELIRGFSVEVARQISDGSLDFVYLDADHSYDAVTADLTAWLPKLRPGGLMAGHDFVDYEGELGRFQVRSAVMDFAGKHGYQLFVSEEWWPSLWFFRV